MDSWARVWPWLPPVPGDWAGRSAWHVPHRLASERSAQDGPIAIGSRRELFVDDYLVDRLSGKAEMRLHHPEPKEVVLKHDAPGRGAEAGITASSRTVRSIACTIRRGTSTSRQAR